LSIDVAFTANCSHHAIPESKKFNVTEAVGILNCNLKNGWNVVLCLQTSNHVLTK